MAKYTYNPPYNQWSGNRSDTLNKWKVNYKGSIAIASALPEEGEFKGDTYNVLEDGSNYMWNGTSWDKLDANTYIGATSEANGIRGLVPPASSSERNKFLRGDGTYKDVTWSAVTGKPSTYPPSEHTHDWLEVVNKPEIVIAQNHPASHNGIFRGKDLTNVYTLDQISAKLQNNDWSDLYIGDYITKTFENLEGVEETVDFVFADFDYWYGIGDTECTTHHILCIPRDCFVNYAPMNSTATTAGGYPGSAMWTTLQEYYTKLNAVKCLNGHILTHRDWIPDVVNTDVHSSGIPTANGATYYSDTMWRNVTIGLMKELMVYGSTVFSSSGYDTGCSKRQLALFNFHHEFIKAGKGYGENRCTWWLGAVSTITHFCLVNDIGLAGNGRASNSLGVRPYLLLS